MSTNNLNATCFRCGDAATEWFDGPAAQERGTARAICAKCEYADWRATARALGECPIG